jgi:hypothetical protein
VIEEAALKHGFTLSTARWIEELAKELRIKEKRFLKAVVKLAKHGVWLEADDWRFVAQHVDLSRHLDTAVVYVIRRVAAGDTPVKAVRKFPEAAGKPGMLSHIRQFFCDLV